MSTILNLTGRELTDELKGLGVVEVPESISQLVRTHFALTADELVANKDDVHDYLEKRIDVVVEELKKFQWDEKPWDGKPEDFDNTMSVYVDPAVYAVWLVYCCFEVEDYDVYVPVRENDKIISLIKFR